MKGITPLISSVLLVLIAVSLAGAFTQWNAITQENAQGSGTGIMERSMGAVTGGIKIDNVDCANGKVQVRNTGSSSISTDDIGIYVNDVLVNPVWTGGPGEFGKNKVKEASNVAGLGPGSKVQISAHSFKDVFVCPSPTTTTFTTTTTIAGSTTSSTTTTTIVTTTTLFCNWLTLTPPSGSGGYVVTADVASSSCKVCDYLGCSGSNCAGSLIRTGDGTFNAPPVKGIYGYYACPGSGYDFINVTTTSPTTTTTIGSCNICTLGTPVVTPPSPASGQSFNISCPASPSGYDCVHAFVDSTQCTWIRWSGGSAIFTCPPQPSGSHTAICKSVTGTSDNCCASEKTLTFTIGGTTTTTSSTTTTITFGNIYYVSTSGSDSNPGTITQPFKTIQKGVDVAQAGDAVYVRAGTYYEAITMKNSGSSGKPITIAGYPGDASLSAIIDGTGKTGGLESNTGILYLNNKKYITFHNLRFQNSGNYGVYTKWDSWSNPSTDITIEYCDFYNIRSYAVQFVNEAVATHYRMKVTHCTFDRIHWPQPTNGEECVGFNQCENCEFSYNKMTHIGKIGFDFGKCKNSVAHHNDIDVTDMQEDSCGIYVIAGNAASGGESSGIHIYDNYIHGNRQLIGVANERQYVKIKDVTIENNVLVETGSKVAIIQFNQAGRTPSYYENIKIIHNTIVTSGSTCINLAQGDPYFTDLVVANNILYGGTAYSIATTDKIVTNNLNTNPMFTNTGTGAERYKLQSGSPAIDKASSAYATSTDFDGKSRPQGAGYDIGAYEYGSGTTTTTISTTTSFTTSSFTTTTIATTGYTNLTVAQAYSLLTSTANGVQTPIDVRLKTEWNDMRINTPSPENPQNWPNLHLGENLSSFLTTYQGKEIILYCRSGVRSQQAAGLLVAFGFTGKIYNMLGGLTAWNDAGYPVTGNMSGTLTIYSDVYPAGAGYIVFDPLKIKYTFNETVKAYAVANPGYVFKEWDGCGCVSDLPQRYYNPVTFTMDASKTVNAIFTLSSSTTTTTIGSCNICTLGTPVVTPPSPASGQSFNISCPASPSGYDCVHAFVDTTQCTWIRWSGGSAIFTCPPQPSGSHTAVCKSVTGTSDNCCASEKTLTFTVGGTTTTTTTTSSTTSTTIPTTSSRMQKMVICYSGRYDNPGVKEYIAQHFDLDDTELSSYASDEVQWMKNNASSPNFKVIGYYESIFSDDAASDWSTVNSHEDWFMHTTSGSRVERDTSTGYTGQYLMNPNSGWSNYMATRCKNALTSYPMYDGVFMDDYAGDLESTAYGPYNFMDANTHVKISLPYEGKIGNSYTRANWKNWMIAYTNNLRTTLGSDMIMTNNHIDTYLGNIAGAMLWEGFVHSRSSNYSSNGYSPSYILQVVGLLHDQALQGKIISTNGGCSGGTASQKEEWAKFEYACLSFAVEDPTKAYFSWEFMPSDPATGNPTWYSWMDTELGAPESNYQKIADPYVYERTFANYYVIANLDNLGTSKTFTFNSKYYTLEGKHALLIQKSPTTTSTTTTITSTTVTSSTTTTMLSGKIYYVSTSGSDSNPGTLSQPWRTIQKAANSVSAGYTVYIRGGTYNEKVTISNRQGSSSAWITFMPYNNEKVIVSGSGISGTYDGVFLLQDGCSFIRITGLEIKNASYAGIFLYGGEITDIRIDNCTIHDCQGSGIYAYSGSYGTKYVRRVEFDHNNVYDVHLGHLAQEAISFSGVLGFNIHHNTLSKYGKEGIDVKSGSSDGSVHHNIVDNTHTEASTQYLKTCIYVDAMTRTNKNIDIYDNLLKGNSGPGIVLGPEEITGALEDIWIYNNDIYLTSRAGFTQYRGIDCTIPESGYVDHKWKDVYIIHNSIYSGADQHIVRIVPSTVNVNNLVIANNIITGTTYYQLYFQNMLPSDMPGKVALTNNLYYRYGGTAHNRWKSTENPTGGWGSNYVLTDPKFVDFSTNNLRLQGSSPAIDNASSSFALTSDYDGNTRPKGSGFDIGAFEYNGSSDPYKYVIHNSLGHQWPAEGQYVQTAIDDLGGAGDVWLPATTLTLSGLKIRNNGVSIHGYGPKETILQFTSSSYGIRAAKNPDLSPDTLFQWGISNITLEGFKFTNGALFLVVRKNFTLNNLVGEDIHTSTAAVRLVCPYGTDSNGDGVTDSVDAKAENILIKNVLINKSSSFGFQLNSVRYRGCLFDNITFDNSTSLYAGCYLWSPSQHGSWSTGFDLCEGYSIPDGSGPSLTVRNVKVLNSVAKYAWESGFHFESDCVKENIIFQNCEGSYNGQKYLTTEPDVCPTHDCKQYTDQTSCNDAPMDYCYWYTVNGVAGCHYWSSGPYGSGFFGIASTMTLTNCKAYGNGHAGFYCPSGNLATLTGCSGDSWPTNSNGNGWGTGPYGLPWNRTAGKCRNCCP